MSLLNRLRARLSGDHSRSESESSLARAERLLRSGGSVDDVRAAAGLVRPKNDIERAWVALFLGDVATALDLSYGAAMSRPYDVDSRIVHGTVRLARNELEHAAHEFDAVIEEFGAEADAADGRRAVILARGHAPLDELPASDREWAEAAVLLTSLWRLVDCVETRLDALAEQHDTHADCLSVIMESLATAESTEPSDCEAERGVV